ncbi:YycH family regulatory protein [Fictibacillus phosphorivorans]|uniref:YycH family regulatory protein n=1 Tax=Fictibacillus phosphorivorans TaxID=1221500 RepID=UPI00203B87D3|nr:two-component system activity regulator YycH [Fictibacillus phosphorivorans]MCM3719529.1 two-component system activity regulator YycH [Fictibacillus phosphorivorans]MCM3777220.1 two-component system activity regulator YycH [Fictibacillus phosphorivorans]
MNWLKWVAQSKKIINLFHENYELIKSITLTLLILLSLVLTWSLWTFKPSYSTIEDARTVKKQEVVDEKDLTDVVRPTQVIYHKESQIYGAEASPIIEEFHKGLKDTKFTVDTTKIETFEPDEKIGLNNSYIEVIYPVNMTQDIYKGLFKFNSASGPDNVDRIFLYQDKDTDGIEGYLVSYQSKKMQKIKALNNALIPFIKGMGSSINNGDFVSYMKYDLERRKDNGESEITKRLYFPAEKISLNRYNYLSNSPNQDTYEMYKKALFKDPLAVKSATSDNKITYADGTAAMVVNTLQNRFSYKSFTGMSNINPTPTSPLSQSIRYINTHAGWGNPYILSNVTGRTTGSTEFWLFVESLPVLDSNMQMSLKWNYGELQEYNRSMVQLDLSEIPSSQSSITLPSGKAVIEKVESESNTNNIKDIRIGYTMEKRETLYTLVPRWFINYENSNMGYEQLRFKQGREEGF